MCPRAGGVSFSLVVQALTKKQLAAIAEPTKTADVVISQVGLARRLPHRLPSVGAGGVSCVAALCSSSAHTLPLCVGFRS